MRRLSSFLREIADEACEIVALEAAKAVIADVDGADFDWTRFRAEYPQIPTIVLSRQRPDIEGVIWVPKPIMEVALLEAISWGTNQVGRGKKSATGSRHGVDMVVNPAHLEQATGRRDADSTLNIYKFDDSKTLFRQFSRAITRATESGRVVTVNVADEGHLALLPKDSMVAISGSQAQLLGWTRDEDIADKLSIRGLNAEQESTLLGRLDQYRDLVTFDALLWKLAVWTARGRLPEGADPDTRYYLRCWPNFTRLMVLPHSIRIAALGVREPMTLIFIADTLEIAPADVFSFYYAAMAIGLAGPAQRADDYLLANRSHEGDSSSGVQRAVMNIGRNNR